MKVVSVEPTPNPNACKFVCDQTLTTARASFRTPGEAIGHPIGERLMAIDGVASVMLLDNFVTVVRRPDSPWPAMVAAVRCVLNAAY